MKPGSAIAALIAIFALMAEPVSSADVAPKPRSLVAKLCGGGEIEIPLGPDDEAPEQHCPSGKACHASACRKQFDPGQRPRQS